MAPPAQSGRNEWARRRRIIRLWNIVRLRRCYAARTARAVPTVQDMVVSGCAPNEHPGLYSPSTAAIVPDTWHEEPVADCPLPVRAGFAHGDGLRRLLER